MTKITMSHGLPFIAAQLQVNGQQIFLDHILIDTGSKGTFFKTDDMETVGITPSLSDTIERVIGIGKGFEYVVVKRIAELRIENLMVTDFVIEMGTLIYDIPLRAIIGADFLVKTGAVVDLKNLELRQG